MRMLRTATVLSACIFILTACGGGGGGRSGPGSGQGGGPITPTPAASVTVAITSPEITASLAQGDPLVATVSGTWNATNLGNGSVYLQVSDSAGSFTVPAIQAAPGNNSFSYPLPLATETPAGERNGTITVRACKDSACSATYAGASSSVAYRLTLARVGDWQTIQGNASHNGYVPIQLDPSRFAKAWEWRAPRDPGADEPVIGFTVTDASGVYALVVRDFADVGYQDGFVALDEATGVQRWLKSLGPRGTEMLGTQLAYSEGKLYHGVVNAPYGLVALDPATGNTAFTSSAIAAARTVLPPTPYGGDLFAQEGIRDGLSSRLVSMNGSGGLRWGERIANASKGQGYFTPAVDSQHVYYHSACCLEIIDRQNGGMIASIANPGSDATNLESRFSATQVGSRGNVLAVTSSPTPNRRVISSFNIANRTHEWVTSLDYLPYLAVANGIVYAARTQDGQPVLHALDESTGRVLWAWSPPASHAQTTALGNIVVTRNLVFFSTANPGEGTGRLWAVDLASRQAAWNYPAPGNLAISANRTLYLAPTGNGFGYDTLIAFKLR